MPSSFTLGEHYESFIKDLVASGRYASASEVMRDSLRLMEEREHVREAKLQALRASIQEGLDSGPSQPLDMKKIRTKAQKQHAAKTSTQHGR
jgi:antitoxin ParD1/3/4